MTGTAANRPFWRRLRALLTLAVPLVLALVLELIAPAPSTSWASLTQLQEDPAAPLVALVALGAWACTVWLLLVVAVTVCGRLPGAAGRIARRTARRVAPASVRALLKVAVGTTVAVSVFGGTPSALADDRPAITSSYDWPGVALKASPAPELDWPSVPPNHAAPKPPAPAPTRAAAVAHPGPAAGTDVIVHAGDTLWGIAARDLGPEATPTQVAQAWPRWWSANRTVLGDHPELIHPGEHLTAPHDTHR